MDIKEININKIKDKRVVVVKISSILTLYNEMGDNTFSIITCSVDTKNIYFQHQFKYNSQVFFSILNMISQYKNNKVDDYIVIYNDDSEVCLLSNVKFI